MPDILSNSAGVTVGYFEWVQGNIRLLWSQSEIYSRLDNLLIQACEKVFQASKRNQVTLRDAAMQIALERIVEARRLRGLYP
jgi:glutamate dehydrogenase (NAD(P)+)